MMKVISKIGDVCAEDYGGGAVAYDTDDDDVEWTYEDAEGRLLAQPVKTVTHRYFMEYTHGLETDHPGEDRYGDEVGDLTLEVYRVDLDEPAWSLLSGHGDAMKIWEEISESCGQDFHETVALAKSKDPLKIAGALEMYAGHWGWINLDHEPMRMKYSEVETRWET